MLPLPSPLRDPFLSLPLRLPLCLRPVTLATSVALVLWILGPRGTLGFVNFVPLGFPKPHGTHPDLSKTTPELIRTRGYPVEVHHVVTPDGYVLELHRIPGPRFSHASSPEHPGPRRRRRQRRRAGGRDLGTRAGQSGDGTLCNGEEKGLCEIRRKEQREEERKGENGRVRTLKEKSESAKRKEGEGRRNESERVDNLRHKVPSVRQNKMRVDNLRHKVPRVRQNKMRVDNLQHKVPRVRQNKMTTPKENSSSVRQDNTWENDFVNPHKNNKHATSDTNRWKNTTSEHIFQPYSNSPVNSNATDYTENDSTKNPFYRKRTSRSSGRRVVLIQHCIFCSSADFVMNDPDQALAFLLADRGYDVWLGNFRGNTYSRKHTRMNPESQEFWRFSWNEMGMYDLPATLQYVLDQTSQRDLYYVGHSMGTTAFFVMMHHFPHLNQQIRAMAAMAPVAYVHNQRGPFTKIVKPLLKFTGVLELFNKGELGKRSPFLDSIISGICNSMTSARSICLNLLFTIAGPNSEFVDKEYLPVILAHTPDGTSLRSVTHYAQLNAAKRFGAFDYGPVENRRLYGNPSPPSYSLNRVRAPVALFWSLNDWVADYQDSIRVSKELGNLALSHQVTEDTFNHMDFLWAEQANTLVYSHLIRFLDSY